MDVARDQVASGTVHRVAIEVFADITCPFAHVGLRRFVARREEHGTVGPWLRVRAWPLELVNGAPLAPAHVARRVDELRAQVAPDLFGGFDGNVVPASSMPAFELVAAAYELGDEVGERVSLAVRAAFFEQGLDIGAAEVLERIAESEGIKVCPADAERIVIDDYEEGKRRGVRGSPEFYLDGRGWYCPSLRIEKVDGHLTIEPDTEAIEAFLAACFV
jgi:predicted DsbA family dithiol-disulfide isomerase